MLSVANFFSHSPLIRLSNPDLILQVSQPTWWRRVQTRSALSVLRQKLESEILSTSRYYQLKCEEFDKKSNGRYITLHEQNRSTPPVQQPTLPPHLQSVYNKRKTPSPPVPDAKKSPSPSQKTDENAVSSSAVNNNAIATIGGGNGPNISPLSQVVSPPQHSVIRDALSPPKNPPVLIRDVEEMEQDEKKRREAEEERTLKKSKKAKKDKKKDSSKKKKKDKQKKKSSKSPRGDNSTTPIKTRSSSSSSSDSNRDLNVSDTTHDLYNVALTCTANSVPIHFCQSLLQLLPTSSQL